MANVPGRLPANLGGAVDLSSLVNRRSPADSVTPSASGDVAAEGALAAEPGVQSVIKVASLVQDVAPTTLANFVKISDRLPVLVEFYTLRSETSPALSQKLAAEVNRRNGDFVLLRLDGDNSQVGQLLQAFQIQGLPAVAALLAGQPIPLFNGDQEESAVKAILDRLLIMARENGLSGRAEVDADAPAPAEPQLPPRHKAGFEAMESGDYAEAAAQFEAAIKEAPADAIAAKGLAQARLLLRTDKLELDKVLAAPAATIADVILKADVLAVIGHFDKAFDALLSAFAVAPQGEREPLRQHLLELFKVAETNDPNIPAARARLAGLLY